MATLPFKFFRNVFWQVKNLLFKIQKSLSRFFISCHPAMVLSLAEMKSNLLKPLFEQRYYHKRWHLLLQRNRGGFDCCFCPIKNHYRHQSDQRTSNYQWRWNYATVPWPWQWIPRSWFCIPMVYQKFFISMLKSQTRIQWWFLPWIFCNYRDVAFLSKRRWKHKVSSGFHAIQKCRHQQKSKASLYWCHPKVGARVNPNFHQAFFRKDLSPQKYSHR